ncbi:hypothetical protein ACFL2R_02045 [Patescibacteria group bacterium]
MAKTFEDVLEKNKEEVWSELKQLNIYAFSVFLKSNYQKTQG